MYNILICDDEQDIVNALKIYLSGGDYCLFEASNGREALEVVEKNDIHLILMDVMMPNVDGLTTARIIRALDRPDVETVPILALTANAFAEDARKCLDADMNAHLAKPLNMPLVKATIAKFTQH